MNNSDKVLFFKCSVSEHCLALREIKRKIPWIACEELKDGTIVLSGRPVKYVRTRNLIKRCCSLCKNQKTR